VHRGLEELLSGWHPTFDPVCCKGICPGSHGDGTPRSTPYAARAYALAAMGEQTGLLSGGPPATERGLVSGDPVCGKGTTCLGSHGRADGVAEGWASYTGD